MNKNEAPWASRIEKVLDSMRTSEKGLTTSEAQKRLREFGFNRIPEKEKDTDWKYLFPSLPNEDA